MSPTTAADFPPIFPTSNGSNFADKKPCNGLGFDFSNNGFNGSGGFVFVFGAKHDKSASEFGLGKKSSADDPLSKLCGGFKGLNIDSDIDKDKVFGNNGDFDAGKESFSEFGGKFEFCASRSDATEKSMKKKTRGKARQSLHSPLNQKDQVFSLSGNATENVPRYSGIFFIATENSKPTSGNNEPCKKPEISSKIQQETEPKPSEQDGLSARRDRPKKKYRLKVGKTPAAQNSPRVVKGSAELKNVGLKSECERWRMRGNQAYNNEDMSKADQFYTNGINCVRGKNVEGFYSKSLALCYNNRAATRMSFGRLREALQDCKFAARENPAFLKAKLRAANCHLLLGEIEEAIHNYNDCLEDTRLMIEANEGIQKALQVSDSLCQSANNLQQTTSDAARAALKEINKGLSISSYSERLLEMRGQSLFLLRRYNEVIDLCEKTLADAEKNFQNSERQWRWCLMSKCQLHLGRLEVAKDLTERLEYVSPLAASIGECLHRKKAGNEAFQSGKHSEAVEHYTAAISSSLEFDSRPFAALCYCNRAAAHQALGQVADAIADCSVAIALDGEYVKAVSRRASLHESIRDYKQAIADLYKTLPLSEKSAQMELKRRVSLLEEKTKHEEAPMDFYLILGMKASDSEADIKKAYKRAALKHHPDKACQYLARMNSGKSWKEVIEKVHEDAERLFKMIGEAYAVLSDADKRSNYDSEEQIRNYPFCSARRSSKYDYDQNFGSYNYHSPYEKYQNSGSYRRYRRNWHPDF